MIFGKIRSRLRNRVTKRQLLEELDKWGTRLSDEIKNMQAVASSDEDDKQPTEAQIKREWFGEDE